MKFKDFFKEWGFIIITILLVLLHFKSCNTNREIEKAQIKYDKKIHTLDSTYNAKLKTIEGKILTDSLVEVAFSNEMWDFLELEELADKKGVSITELKHYRNKKENK
jgi:hypothetical protein